MFLEQNFELVNKLIIRLSDWLKKEKSYIDHWNETDERIRFGLAGIANMGLRYLFFAVTIALFGKHYYQLWLLLTWLISSIWAFFMYKNLVFQSKGNHWREYGKSLLVWFVSYFINAALLSMTVSRWQWNIYVAQGTAILIIVVVNYLLFKHFAFRQPRPLKVWEKLLRFFDVFGLSSK